MNDELCDYCENVIKNMDRSKCEGSCCEKVKKSILGDYCDENQSKTFGSLAFDSGVYIFSFYTNKLEKWDIKRITQEGDSIRLELILNNIIKTITILDINLSSFVNKEKNLFINLDAALNFSEKAIEDKMLSLVGSLAELKNTKH